MYELKKMERYLRVNLLGPGPRLIKKKNLPGLGLTKVEKHCYRPCAANKAINPYKLQASCGLRIKTSLAGIVKAV